MDHFDHVDDFLADTLGDEGYRRSQTITQRVGERMLSAFVGREYRFSQKTRGRVGAATLTMVAIATNQTIEHFTGINPFFELCINAPQ